MINFLKKIITKNNMEDMQEIDIESLDLELGIFSYKWTKGDNDGKICEYDSIFKDPTTGIIWVNFKDGTRINYELLDQYMIQIDKQSNNPTKILGNHTISIIEESEKELTLSHKNVMLSDKLIKKVELNPIVSLLEKQKPNWVNVEIQLKLNLPTKKLYDVLTSSFDNAEDEIIEFVVNDLDLEIIKESLRINIKEIYRSNGTKKSGNKISSED
jgi:hypothetical protein